ncbi:MAG: OmpH family outer membrane protein [Phycisphaeraceae bacterium]|nr:OmpH family outer membrane protein [Phycisphaeraceae bacterium]
MSTNPMHSGLGHRTLAIIAACCCTLTLGYALAMQSGRASAPPASPTAVGVVDLNRLFTNIAAFEKAKQDLAALRTELESKINAKKAELEGLQGDISVLPAGSAALIRAENELMQKSFDLRAEVEFSGRKEMEAEAQAIRRIFRLIRQESAAFAQARGFELILFDDSREDVFDVASLGDLMRDIGLRRVLYAVDRIDVTDELIARLNARAAP